MSFNIKKEYIMKSSAKMEKSKTFSWDGLKLKALTFTKHFFPF